MEHVCVLNYLIKILTSLSLFLIVVEYTVLNYVQEIRHA
jgi:hypothetical protein